jgi:hypothetical protein
MCPGVCLWSPTGVQTADSGALVFAPFVRANFRPPNAPGLSPPIKTRQTRHLAPNLLRLQVRSMSGSPENPTSNPTNCRQKPDKMRLLCPKSLFASQNPHNTQNSMARECGARGLPATARLALQCPWYLVRRHFRFGPVAVVACTGMRACNERDLSAKPEGRRAPRRRAL